MNSGTYDIHGSGFRSTFASEADIEQAVCDRAMWTIMGAKKPMRQRVIANKTVPCRALNRGATVPVAKVDVMIPLECGGLWIVEVKKFSGVHKLNHAIAQLMFYKFLCNTMSGDIRLAVASDYFPEIFTTFVAESYPQIALWQVDPC